MAVLDTGSSTAGKANVDASYNLQVNTPGHTAAGVERGGGPENAGVAVCFAENDPGEVTGVRYVRSPECDEDFRGRVAHDTILERDNCNYATQNTGKYFHQFTTLTATISANGLLTNSGSSVATTVGMTYGTTAEWQVGLGANTVFLEFNFAINQAMASIPANCQIDIGMFRRAGATPFAPTDGVYFRFDSNGVTAVANNNAVEQTLVLPATGFLANENHKYTMSVTEREVEFWIDDVRYGSLSNASTQGQIFRSASLPFSLRHANTNTTSSAVQGLLTDFTISNGGPVYTNTMAQVGNRTLGSYQGLSGGTMGSLANYANSANPTSAAGSNTAANVTGLGGQGAINAAAAAATDFIMCSYQVPAGTIAVQGRRLVVSGVNISCANLGAAVATTATTIALSLAFGHTAVSLATAETASFATATTKAPRRIPLGIMFWNVGAVVGATPQNGDIYIPFTNPIYVNPGEFIATTLKFLVGTATVSQSIWYHVTFDYGWE